jgi:hypothetical protein
VQHLNATFLDCRSGSKEPIEIYFTIFGANLITQTILKAFLFPINKRKGKLNSLFENGPVQWKHTAWSGFGP